jgi:hypothetical protein
MSNINYNMSELFAVAFGYGTPRTPVVYISGEGVSTADMPAVHFDLPVIQSKEQAVELTKLGTPILFPITFVGKGYNKFDKQGRIVQVNMADFRLPASTFVELSREKNETTTTLSGGTGSVKELYGFGDWNIAIKGVCFNEPGHPTAKTTTEQKNKLYEWEALADAIQIESTILREFEIFNLFIKRLSIAQLAGKPDLVPYTMECYSDEPLELFNI